MMIRYFGVAIALLMGLTFLQASPVNASTVSVTYNYVYFGSIGKHQRQPRTITSGGFTTISSQTGDQSATGLTFQPGQLPSKQMVGQQTFNFSFVTITGGSTTANGPPTGVTSTNAMSPPSVVVQTSPIVVLVVYVPTGGSCNGPCPPGSGATIDAFDETTGSLFNDTFVKVAPDSGGVTMGANVNGYVDTTNTAETMTALSPSTPVDNTTPPNGDKFSRWVNLESTTATTNGNALSVGKGVSAIALAFYDALPPGSQPPPSAKTQCQQQLASLNQIAMDRGPLLLVTQYNNIKAALQKCVLERYLTQAQVTQAENAYQNMLNSRNTPAPPPLHH